MTGHGLMESGHLLLLDTIIAPLMITDLIHLIMMIPYLLNTLTLNNKK